ncbi:MAG: iron-containing alcohol dehydrogenase family protein [Verrucomicrobiales bacterium]|nr:iron-containing alcohol dehydrogenase family protein [Verrucomicrobiales bacterium]
MKNTSVEIPTLVRLKPGALDRLGLYCRRAELPRVALLTSQGLPAVILDRAQASLAAERIEIAHRCEVESSSYEHAQAIFQSLPTNTCALLGLGGGKALDVAKYVSFQTRLPYFAVPTSLSNDGFCSPQSSLTLRGRRRSLPSAMPYGVVVDTEICLNAPHVLWCAGIGDSVAKITAVFDWKLAFHARGTSVNDFAALLSDATVFQLMANPRRDLQGIHLLATALMLNGIAMEVAGSSRPASGSEHLISHALDGINPRPRLHGLQVGVATYLVSQLQHHRTESIAALFGATGFWEEIRRDPFSKADWVAAFRAAPGIKPGFYTVLSERDYTDDLLRIVETDPRLEGLLI